MNPKEIFKEELQKLYDYGNTILINETNIYRQQEENNKKSKTRQKHQEAIITYDIQKEYNYWYTVSLPLVKLLIPQRYDDFIKYFKLERRRSNNFNTIEYTISDYLINSREFFKTLDNFDEFNTFSIKFKNN
jgi:hypothetical protein